MRLIEGRAAPIVDPDLRQSHRVNTVREESFRYRTIVGAKKGYIATRRPPSRDTAQIGFRVRVLRARLMHPSGQVGDRVIRQ